MLPAIFLPVAFPADNIVLDSYLKRSENSIARRFVLAHELGHIIYEIVSPGQTQSSFHSEFDMEMEYTPDQLHCIFNLTEIQAIRIGCAVIMPHFLLVNTLHRVMNAEKFPFFGEYQIMPADGRSSKNNMRCGKIPHLIFILPIDKPVKE